MHLAYTCGFQADALERVASEVLGLVRSAKNSFAPINRIPSEVLSTIPDYYREGVQDRVLIALTHVCRDWREKFTSRASLWTRLDFTNIDKTRTYIQRSQSSPLQFCIKSRRVIAIDDALTLIIPHIRRLKSITINAHALPNVLKHFCCPTPLLEKLHIDIAAVRDSVLDAALFNGDLSSLRELRLIGVITNLPWKNLANLRVFDIGSYSPRYGVTQLLNFFESAPLLHTIRLEVSTQRSSDAPPQRIVPLSHLKVLTIRADPPHSTLLRHLHIPIGASLISKFHFSGEESPLLEYLPERSPNFSNLSHITAINLLFDHDRKLARFGGPSGSVCVFAKLEERMTPLYPLDRRILRSIGRPTLSTIQRLAISKYRDPRRSGTEECPVLQALSSTHNLRTLTLIDCNDQPFILALNPRKNPSNLIFCSNLRELVLYTRLVWFDVDSLLDMTKNRASRGAKLSSIRLIGLRRLELEAETEVLKLREYVTHVEYRVGDIQPEWDDVHSESDGEDR